MFVWREMKLNILKDCFAYIDIALALCEISKALFIYINNCTKVINSVCTWYDQQ